ncbi:MAG: PD-(D/E)XK nuclease family protein [Variovorax sp.]
MNPGEGHPSDMLWCAPGTGVVARIAQVLQARKVHPARCVVLVPYAQLMAVARTMWARSSSAGFVPRFETTRNWAASAGGFVAGEVDIAFDMARDLATAQSLLQQAGFGSERMALAGRVVELAMQLAPLAAAELPDQRDAWSRQAIRASEAGSESQWFDLERALARIAALWAGTSAYATDVLYTPVVRDSVDLLIALDGFQTDPLVQKLSALRGEHAMHLPLIASGTNAGHSAWHVAADPEDESELAAACVMRHLNEGRAPVALVATDRALARRISARLVAAGAAPHDETGWKLSTTRAAATLMSALRACAHDASSDQVLDWLKGADSDTGLVQMLEARLRRDGHRDWLACCGHIARSEHPQDAALQSFCVEIEERRALLMRARPLADWLPALRELLESDGRWDALEADLAGARLLAALWLDDEDPQITGGRHTLAEFTAWVRDVLEAASFVPSAGTQAPLVVVLPLHQLLGRAFAAVVVPGCDDRRLPVSPEPPGNWSVEQRAALGLPSRQVLEAAQRSAWATALGNPACDLIWRRADASGEPVRSSPLVQTLQLDGSIVPGIDPRGLREVLLTPTPRPQPVGARLPLQRISATMYEDLRRCPYRFFALRQLALRSADELDADVDKRDFGNWLHAVLGHFHESLKAAPMSDRPARLAMMADARERATRESGLSDAEFLPFAAAWPAVRDGYLTWLLGHEAGGIAFVEAEPAREQEFGTLQLAGRLDRIDRTSDGRVFVIDYKTESAAKTKDRVKDPTEDTQLAFYAALLADDTLRAAYVNVGEKSSGTQTVEQFDVVEARDALIAGLIDDFARIDAGAALPALGDGAVCEHCTARGLCRKDFWT